MAPAGNQRLPLDVLETIADFAGRATLALVCREWRVRLHGRHIELHGAGDGTKNTMRMLRQLLPHAGTDGDVRTISIQIGPDADEDNNLPADVEACVLAVLTHLLDDDATVLPRQLDTLRLSLRTGGNHRHMSPFVERSVTRILRSLCPHAVASLTLEDGGATHAWWDWADALGPGFWSTVCGRPVRLHRLRLRSGSVHGGSDTGPFHAMLAHLPFAPGLRDLDVSLDGSWAAPWCLAMRAGDTMPASELRALSIEFRSGPAVALLVGLEIGLCVARTTLRRLRLRLTGDRDCNRADHPMINPVDVLRLWDAPCAAATALCRVDLDLAACGLTSLQLAIVLCAALALPELAELCVQARCNSGVNAHGLPHPCATPLRCANTLRQLWIDLSDTAVTDDAVARWTARMREALTGASVVTVVCERSSAA